MTRSRLLNPSMDLAVETATEARERYLGFGADLLSRLREFPGIEDSLTFYRNTDGTDDVWAIYSKEDVEFGIQLDPDTEVICIWGDSWHEEIGDWISQPTEYALQVIRDRFAII